MGFQKNKEDFICENCGNEVKGNGYTNHCPNCLWSKHIDILPGDRACDCKGMMPPISYDKEGEEISLTHKCLKCGFEKRNKIAGDDNFDELLKYSKK
jgi:hypothetical protein